VGYYASASAEHKRAEFRICLQAVFQLSLESAAFGAKPAESYFTIYLVTALELSSTEDSSNTVFKAIQYTGGWCPFRLL